MEQNTLQLILDLRHALHSCAEISGQEIRTKAALIAFLQEHTHLSIVSCGEGFYAAYRAAEKKHPAIMLRADYDALATDDGGACHLCGHDGHAAALCGVAMMLEKVQPDRDVLLLFQPAEETGAGAAPCCELFDLENVAEVYGCHNLPGFEHGVVMTRPGTFSCASEGLTLCFAGKPTHAAYPELGISPARTVGTLLCELDALAAQEKYEGLVLCTVIGVDMGTAAFGAAAANALIRLTLRGEKNRDLEKLRAAVLACAEELAAQAGLGFSYQEQDVFPAAENTPELAEKVLALTGGSLLKVPMRWSEDFGHYLLHKPGVMFGVGSGVDHPGLHTENYEYPDSILEATVQAFLTIVQGM